MAEGSAATDGGTAAPKSFDESFNAAFEAAAGGAEGEGGGEGVVEGEGGEATDDSDGAEDSGTDDSSDDTTAADTSEEGQTDEASSGTDEGEDQTPGVGDEPETPKLKALFAKIDEAKTPEERRAATKKYIDAAIQPKFQAVAATRKFVDAFRKNPVAAARQVLAEAAKKGMVTADGEAPSGGDGEGVAAFKATLTAAGFTEKQADVVVGLIRPLQQQNDEAALNRLAGEVDADLTSFKKDFPDFDELEPKMSAIMDKVLPAPSSSRREYLEMIRTIALGGKAVSTGVKKALKGIVKDAKNAAPKTRSVPDSTVQPGRSGKPLSFEESAALAMEGKRVGRGISR